MPIYLLLEKSDIKNAASVEVTHLGSGISHA